MRGAFGAVNEVAHVTEVILLLPGGVVIALPDVVIGLPDGDGDCLPGGERGWLSDGRG